MKFTLISDHEQNGPKVTYEFEEDFLEDVVLNIEQFLKGTGFVFDSLEVNKEPFEESIFDDTEELSEEDRVIENIGIDSAVWPFPTSRPNEINEGIDLDFGEAGPTLRVDTDDFKIILDNDNVHSSR